MNKLHLSTLTFLAMTWGVQAADLFIPKLHNQDVVVLGLSEKESSDQELVLSGIKTFEVISQITTVEKQCDTQQCGVDTKQECTQVPNGTESYQDCNNEIVGYDNDRECRDVTRYHERRECRHITRYRDREVCHNVTRHRSRQVCENQVVGHERRCHKEYEQRRDRVCHNERQRNGTVKEVCVVKTHPVQVEKCVNVPKTKQVCRQVNEPYTDRECRNIREPYEDRDCRTYNEPYTDQECRDVRTPRYERVCHTRQRPVFETVCKNVDYPKYCQVNCRDVPTTKEQKTSVASKVLVRIKGINAEDSTVKEAYVAFNPKASLAQAIQNEARFDSDSRDLLSSIDVNDKTFVYIKGKRFEVLDSELELNIGSDFKPGQPIELKLNARKKGFFHRGTEAFLSGTPAEMPVNTWTTPN